MYSILMIISGCLYLLAGLIDKKMSYYILGVVIIVFGSIVHHYVERYETVYKKKIRKLKKMSKYVIRNTRDEEVKETYKELVKDLNKILLKMEYRLLTDDIKVLIDNWYIDTEKVINLIQNSKKYLCSYCNVRVDENDKVCPECGSILEEVKIFKCTNCGKEVKSSDTECPHCHAVFEE